MLPRSRKIISGAIAACLAVTMMPAVSSVAYADELQAASVVTQSNPNEFNAYWGLNEDDLKGVSFDSKTNTLTLKNVNISSGSYHSVFEVNKAKKSDYTLTINIVGDNKISANEGSVIDLNDSGCKVNVVVKGNGTLRTDDVNLICTRSGSVDIKSSTLDLRNVPYDTGAITAKKGTVTVNKDAKVSITAKKPESEYNLSYAINAKKMTNSYKSLVKIDGIMPVGAEIKGGNAVYVVNKDVSESESFSYGVNKWYTNNTVTLKKWLSGKTVKFSGAMTKNIMGFKYRINKVANNAFNNKAGKKVKKLYFNGATELRLCKKSFKGLKNVSKVYITPQNEFEASPICYGWIYFNHDDKTGTPVAANIHKSSYTAKKCFSDVGKSKGKKLTVKILPCKTYIGKRKHIVSINKWEDKGLVKRIVKNKLGFSKATIKFSKACYKDDPFKLKEIANLEKDKL